MTTGKIIDISNDDAIELFVQSIQDKKIVIFPCETVYGICFDLLDEKCKERAYQIKGRPKEKIFSAAIPSVDYLDKVGIIPNNLEKKAMEWYWPGQLKIAFTSDFAVNQAEHKWLRDILWQIDTIVATTSANKSGRPAASKAKDLDPEIIDNVDFVFVDDSKIYHSTTTTVVRLKGKIEILRQGVVEVSEDILHQ